MSHCIYNFSTVLYLNGITLHWNNSYSLSFPLPKDQQGGKKPTSSTAVFTSVPSLKVLNSLLCFENLMTKWHLTLIVCFFFLRGEKKKREFRLLKEISLCPAWSGTVCRWSQGQREGEDSCPGSVFSLWSEQGTSIFVALCTFHSSGTLIGTRFVYWGTFPASPSGNSKAGPLPLLALTCRPCPHLPFLWCWLLVPARFPPAPEAPGWVLLAPRTSCSWLASGSKGRAGEIGSAGNVVCLLSHNYLWQINDSSSLKRVWESIAVPQPQNADNTWYSAGFPLKDPFFAIAWKKVLNYFLSAQI